MQKWMIAGGIVLLVLLWIGGIYNGMVGKDQNVAQSWAQIENQLQRRYDLIPNLVNTVKGYAKYEKSVFEAVTKARSAWAGAKSGSEKVTAANQLEGAIGRLIAVAESYPQLKASTNFIALQDELAGTENRIAVARMRYNEAVQDYNKTAKRIPTVLFVKMFGFDGQKEFFKVKDEAAKQAPKVNF